MTRVTGRDPLLTALASLATVLGVFFVWNAAYVQSAAEGKVFPMDPIITLLQFLCVALPLYFWVSSQKESRLRQWVVPAGVLSFLLLAAVPLVGIKRNNARRWLGLEGTPLVIQPAEFAKLGIVLALALGLALYWERRAQRTNPKARRLPGAAKYWVWPTVDTFLMAGAVIAQPDMDTAAVMALMSVLMLWMGGINRRVVLTLLTGGVVLLLAVAATAPYRFERMIKHFDRENIAVREGVGYQTAISSDAINRGNLFGVGFTEGQAKVKLPEVTSDYIMTTVGEEFGFVGFLIAFCVIAGIVGRLWYLSLRMNGLFGRFVLQGLCVWMALQAGLNLMMANGTLWTMGLPMPFFSDGFSSLLALWIGLGVAQACLREDAVYEPVDESFFAEEERPRPVKRARPVRRPQPAPVRKTRPQTLATRRPAPQAKRRPAPQPVRKPAPRPRAKTPVRRPVPGSPQFQSMQREAAYASGRDRRRNGRTRLPGA
ncbi:MAG: FtsW/RodA/SpoVE family cell cycle protein [Armatimonadota bacterium]|jgi:cell division protein FtsW (lipid II flippase)|nr:FtsW/RodA/SpoVE family cell cycle protein [Fimbriimonadaceae bacterium]MCZ8139891.1 FtsW/RodA/SpoVE family cell cycle protein [Fimbriimonadaceae bacterium]